MLAASHGEKDANAAYLEWIPRATSAVTCTNRLQVRLGRSHPLSESYGNAIADLSGAMNTWRETVGREQSRKKLETIVDDTLNAFSQEIVECIDIANRIVGTAEEIVSAADRRTGDD